VQSGFARTGRFFAIEHFGVEPDLITVAKSIAMGMPLSGVLGKAEIMDAPVEGGVGGTYVGNPVAQAAALAVLDVIEDEGLVERSERLGETIRARMLAWQERRPEIREVRGLGSMLAIELDTSARASHVVEEALGRGLLLLKAGVAGNCIRVLVPLVISDAELEEALGAWEQALEAAL
jgi:4-aminobutyrate aminotransferase-like enzyme